MRIVMFSHSLISDWNHGSAHFLRGIASELIARGHDVRVYEPVDAWSLKNLIREGGTSAVEAFHDAYPNLRSIPYHLSDLDLSYALDGASLVIVHEWNTPQLVAALGAQRAKSGHFKLLFHDTHHRAVSARAELASLDLRHYDGALVFGEVLRERYLAERWAQRVWVWHEAADTRVFHPLPHVVPDEDLAWIGNWGDGERSSELTEFLLQPIADLGLRASIYGVRYPTEARIRIERCGAHFRGFVANFEAPQVFARHRLTVHVPRRYYSTVLPGIPTIRVFEALACGIPLISAPWQDSEGLFTPGRDYLVARNGGEMKRLLRAVLAEPSLSASLREHGLQTILSKHTCAHRVDELLEIHRELVAS